MDFKYLFDDEPVKLPTILPEDFNVLAKALESTNSGVVITDYRQPDNPIIFCNHAFENLTGYSRDEIIGRNCRFLQGKNTNMEALIPLKKCITDGQPATIEILNYHKNGSSFWNELSIAPVTDKEGVITHFIGIQNDVTAKKMLHAELHEQIDVLNKRLEKQSRYILKVEEILSRILKKGGDLVVFLDDELRVVKANEYFYSFYQLEEKDVIGFPFESIRNGQWKNGELNSLLLETIKNDKPFDGFTIRLADEGDGCIEMKIAAKKIVISNVGKDFILLTMQCGAEQLGEQKSLPQ